MSSMFDTAVHSLKKGVPFAKPSVVDFMAWQVDTWAEECSFTCVYRRSVASRHWWTMTWKEDGREYSVSAQEWVLCLWRAVQVHKQNERRRELEDQPVSRGVGFFAAESKGYEDGEGI